MLSSRPRQYGIAVLAVGLALLLRLLLQPELGTHALLMPFVLAVLVASWRGGDGPGLLATALSAIAAAYLFMEPVYSLAVSSPADRLQLALFALVGLLISRRNEGALRARAKTTATLKSLQRALDQREELLQRESSARAEAERNVAIVRQLQELAEEALAHLDLEELLEALLIRVKRLLAVDTAAFLLLEGDSLVVRAAKGLEAGVETGFRVPVGQAFAGRIAAEGRVGILEEVRPDDVHSPLLRKKGVRSLLGVPLVMEGQTRGVLHVGTLQPRRFSREEVRVLQLVAGGAALAIDRARLYQEAQDELAERIRLETDLRQQSEQLREQARQLADVDRRKDEFLAMLAHELRNPLAPMLNAVEIMRARPNRSVGQRVREVMVRQVRHMARLVDDLLDVSRITRGKAELRIEQAVLQTIVERAVETARPLIESREHALSVALPSEPLPLEADPTRLEQVLVNLLNNAAKYTDRGGRIQVEVEREASEAVVRVRDTGIGIAPELLPHVFDLFTQAEQSLDRAHGGLGIGLALVERLVTMHGGRVEAHSDGSGHGSEFIVHLQLLENPPREEFPLEEVTDSGRRLRVLVVEDNVDAAQTLGDLLDLWGHQVQVVYEGHTALEVALQVLPEAVLLDIGLPGMDGYEVARRLREQPSLQHVLLVALTGYGQEADRRRSQEAGFDHHLVKPVDPEEMRLLLAGIWER
jgi:signal transduction histidine kinase/CheY-like chemotaxis protein